MDVHALTSQIHRRVRIVVVHVLLFESQCLAGVIGGLSDKVVGIESGGDEEFDEEVSRDQSVRRSAIRRREEIRTAFRAQVEPFQSALHLIDLRCKGSG